MVGTTESIGSVKGVPLVKSSISYEHYSRLLTDSVSPSDSSGGISDASDSELRVLRVQRGKPSMDGTPASSALRAGATSVKALLIVA